MRIYRIWLDSFDVVAKYGMKFLSLSPDIKETHFMKQKYKNCECLKFKVDGMPQEMFNIYEIDSLFAGYRNKEEFLQKLEKLPNEKYQKKKRDNLLVTYTHKEELKQLDLVFNSPLLLLSAVLARKEKIGKKEKTAVSLDKKILQQQEEEFQKLLHKLLSIAAKKETRAYIFSPLATKSLAPKEHLKKLSQYLPEPQIFDTKDTAKYRQIFQNSLYQTLFLYAQAYDAKEEKERALLSTTEEDRNLLTCKGNVSRLLRKDYRTLRNAILFVKTFEEIKAREKEELAKKEDEANEQLKLYISPTSNIQVLDPDTQARCEEIARIEKENEDLLKQYAAKDKAKWENKYKEEQVVEDDGYSFEEYDRLGESEPTTAFIKGKRPWTN